MDWAGEESPGDGVAFLQLPGLDVLDGAATESTSGEGNRERRQGHYRGLGGRILEPLRPVCPDRWMTAARPSSPWARTLSGLGDPLAQHRFSSLEQLNLNILFTCSVTSGESLL